MSKNIDILNIKGEKVGDYTLDESCLEFEKGTQAMHDCVVAFLNECRAGTASTKDRSEVSGTGKKPFKQKGLGRARSGNARNPVWRHGGIAFGPHPRSYSIKINAKVRKLALKRAFSEMIKDNAVVVLDSFTLADAKTKSAVAVLKALQLDTSKVLISVKEYDDVNLIRATGNLASAYLLKASSVNAYQILYSDKLLITKEALDEFVKRLV